MTCEGENNSSNDGRSFYVNEDLQGVSCSRWFLFVHTFSVLITITVMSFDLIWMFVVVLLTNVFCVCVLLAREEHV